MEANNWITNSKPRDLQSIYQTLWDALSIDPRRKMLMTINADGSHGTGGTPESFGFLSRNEKLNSHGSIEPNWPSYLLSNPIITSVLISSSPNWRSKYRLKKHNELDTIHWRCNLTKIVVRHYYFSEVTTPVRGGWQECEALWRRQFLQWLLWRWLVYHVTSAPTPLKGEGLSLHPPFFQGLFFKEMIKIILYPIFHPSSYSVGPTYLMVNLQKGWLGDGMENEV